MTTRRRRWLTAGVLALASAVAVLGGASFAGAAPLPHVGARPSAGCAHRLQVPSEQTLRFTAVGDHGSYTEQVPTTAGPGRALPVVFDFHAYQEPGPLQVTLSALGPYGQSHRFVTVTPWIDNQKIPQWHSTVGSKDMDWFGHLLSHVEATACVDQNRVFVTGYSNGAFMASAIACQYSARVAAVAPVAGIDALAHCPTTRPVPVVAFHGTADPLIHYDGTPSTVAQNLPAPDGSNKTAGQEAKQFGDKGIFRKGPSIPEQAASWARRNHCSTTHTTTSVTTHVALLAWSCPHHADVELYRIRGGGHSWPGSQESAEIAKVVGPTTFEISADAEMWSFFRSHPLTSSD